MKKDEEIIEWNPFFVKKIKWRFYCLLWWPSILERGSNNLEDGDIIIVSCLNEWCGFPSGCYSKFYLQWAFWATDLLTVFLIFKFCNSRCYQFLDDRNSSSADILSLTISFPIIQFKLAALFGWLELTIFFLI
jgi:hypothetical protein